MEGYAYRDRAHTLRTEEREDHRRNLAEVASRAKGGRCGLVDVDDTSPDRAARERDGLDLRGQ